MARASTNVQLETLLDRKDEIIKMDFASLEKLGTLMKNTAANNGVCGLGCSKQFEASTVDR
jgi:hypothetical protein